MFDTHKEAKIKTLLSSVVVVCSGVAGESSPEEEQPAARLPAYALSR